LPLCGASVLAVGAWRWSRARFASAGRGTMDKIALASAIGMGTILSHAWGAKVLAYNSLNNSLALAATGLVLVHFARCASPERPRAMSLPLVGAGALTAWQFFVKYPAGGDAAGLFLLLLLAHGRSRGFRGI